MIWESSYWKDDLLELAKKINEIYKTNSLNEKLGANFEKEVMIALYSIRKLMEASKLSEVSKDIKIKVKSYKSLKNATRLNWFYLNEIYDLRNSKSELINLNKLFNQVIHSYIFYIWTNEQTNIIEGFFFNSDRTRNEKVYYIDINDFCNLLETVGKDYPTTVSYKFDEKISDYRVLSE